MIYPKYLNYLRGSGILIDKVYPLFDVFGSLQFCHAYFRQTDSCTTDYKKLLATLKNQDCYEKLFKEYGEISAVFQRYVLLIDVNYNLQRG